MTIKIERRIGVRNPGPSWYTWYPSVHPGGFVNRAVRPAITRPVEVLKRKREVTR